LTYSNLAVEVNGKLMNSGVQKNAGLTPGRKTIEDEDRMIVD
jgi:hypothetical protein